MDILRTASMFILGIGMFVVGLVEVRKSAKNPLKAILGCFAMSVGLICYILLSKWIFLVVGLIGLILLFILG